MHCPRCDQSFSDFQSICPNCFAELVAGEGRTRPSDSAAVAWPSMAEFSTLEMPRITLDAMSAVNSLDAEADRAVADLARDAAEGYAEAAVAHVPDRNMRDMARERLDNVANRLEERLPEGLRGMAHERLQQTVEQLAGMVPDENAREYVQQHALEQAGRLPRETPREMAQQAQEWAERQAENAQFWGEKKAQQAAQRAERRSQAQQQAQQAGYQRPPNARSPQEIAPNFDVWYKATQTTESQPAATETSGNVGCLNVIMAVISLVVPGLGQIIVGPRGFGVFLFFVWVFAHGAKAEGFATIVAIVAAVTALVGFGRSK
ncbi:MAG: hypothetical protein FJX76_03770 [Armatimonadetes bacterium]|nr:hypothetical protein [Armatimonadota bacterium]